ncbi:hypothetical protein FOA52_008207 [Chlamydomonas sp. UWO 241]|nr:hypothetical protein FOA52_008207 [Chlamydomonas sp. UWO 241]
MLLRLLPIVLLVALHVPHALAERRWHAGGARRTRQHGGSSSSSSSSVRHSLLARWRRELAEEEVALGSANSSSSSGSSGSTCAPGCTEKGTCNEELGRCDCPRHLSGPECSVEASQLLQLCKAHGFPSVGDCFDHRQCINKCNERGTCEAGFCKCEPGFYGTDCALSLGPDGKPWLLEGQGYKPRQRAPRIYVYELPPNMTNVLHNPARLDRPLYYLFWQRLLSAGVRVADGDEADYYFMPIKARMGGVDSSNAIAAVEYVRRHWPWWDEHGGGERHLVVQTGDMGRRDMTRAAQALYTNATWLTHWGLYENHTFAGWEAAHRPGHDIVIPVYVQPALVSSYGMDATPLHPGSEKRVAVENKNQTFFFAGRICGDRKEPQPGVFPNCKNDKGKDGYSAGTRQQLHYHHANRTGFQVVTHTKTYGHDMASSVFCGAPTGGGHGKRNVLVTVLGCIPVTVTDKVYQPFEPEIHWDDFSVALLEADLPRLHEVLAAVTPERRSQMHAALWCGAQHLFWSSLYGSILGDDGRYDAFETVMEILRMRLKHPDVPPERYADTDPEFAAFMRCTSMPLQSPPELCSHSSVKDTGAFPCKQCSNSHKAVMGIPGGAVCCSEAKLAKCPRLWE